MFSSTVRSSNTRRPSITWKTPRRTISSGGAVDALAVELDRAVGDLALLGVEEPGDRLQGGGLAGAVRAEERDDLAPRDLEREPLQDEDHVVVDDLDVLQARASTSPLRAGGGSGRPRQRRYRPSHSGLRGMSYSATFTSLPPFTW